MDNQYEIIARDGDQVLDSYVITNDGNSTSITVQNNVLYDVVEITSGVAPQQVMFKRVNDTLEIRLGETTANSAADVILENYFQLDNPPQFIGLAEDGQYYYFVPQSGLTEDFLESLDDEDVTFQSLGYDTVEEQIVWWPMVLGGVALAGLGALALGGGSSGGSDDDEQPAIGDTQAPNVEINDLEINDSTPALNGRVDDATASVVVTINGEDYPAVNNGDGTWSLQDNTVSELAEGEYVATVTATDSAGNSGSASGTVIIDLTAPNAPTINPGNGSELSGSAEPGSEIQIDIDGDGETDYTTVTDETGSWSITLDPALEDGTEVVVTATDEAGNESDPSSTTIDAQAPNVQVDDLLTNDTTPALSGTIDDPTATVIVSLGGVQYTATNNGDGTWTLADNTLPELADGSYTVTVEATDEAGNKTSTEGQLDVDSTAPDAPQINDTNGNTLAGNAEAGSRVDVDVNGDGVTDYTTTTDENGQWSIIPETPIENGTEVTATATDNAGNSSNPSSTIVDSGAVNVSVYNLITNDSTPALNGLVDNAEATVVVTVNGVDYVVTNQGDGSWSLVDNTLPELIDGTYNVSVTATTPVGVVSIGSGTLVIDTTAPAAPVIDPTDGSEITGTAEAGSEVRLDVDGDGTPDYTTVADGNGDWSITPDTPLTDGTTVTATASDEAGNVSAPATVVVDGVAPTVLMNNVSTNDSTPALSGTVDDMTATIIVTVDGTDYSATNNGDGTWTLADDTLPTLADNSYTVTVTATDEAGNQGTATGMLVVDTTAPAAPVLDPTNGSEITGTAEAGSEVQVDVDGDGTPDYTTVADGNGDWSITPDAPLADGTTVTATASDEAGNMSAPANVVVDGVAPSVLVNDVTTNDATPALTGTVDDATATILVTVNGTDYLATNNGDGTWTLADDTLPALADNSYTVTVTATDEAGNQGTATGTLEVDTVVPVVSVNDALTNDATPALTGTVDDTTASVTVTVNGTDYLATNNGDGTWTLADDTLPTLADNSYTVTVTATDEVGNQGTATGTLEVDTTAPVVTVNDVLTNDATPALTGTVDDTTATIIVTVDGTDYLATNNGDGTWTLADDTLPALADSSYTVTVTASDSAGNQGTATSTLVIDTAAPDAPVINAGNGAEISGTAEANSEINIDVNGDGTPDYTATADENGNWSVTPDSPLNDGTEVVATATDQAGNISDPASSTINSAAATVTVNSEVTNDNTPPLSGTISDPTATVIVNLNGTNYLAVNNGDGTWTIGDDTVPVLTDGHYPLVVTATTATGVSSTASGSLTIDTVAPDAPTLDPTNGSEITGTAEAGSEVQVDVDGDGTPDYTAVADGNGDWSITPDAPLADGTTVTATASDEAGNMSAPANVVVDGVAPSVLVNDVTTNDATPALTGAVDDATATILVTVDGTDYLATNNGDGTWTLADDTLPALADNSYTVTVTATDEAGNQGTATGTLEVDTVVPVVSVNDALTNDATPALTGTVDDATATILVTVNGTDYPATNNGDGTWTLADDTLPALADNSYTVTVTATDEAGNQGTATGTLEVDTVVPVVSVNDALTNDATPALTGTVDDTTASVTVTVNGTDYLATNNGDGTWTLADDTLPTLADNSYTVTVTATDEVGNQGTATGTLEVDTTATVVTVNDVLTNDATPALTGTVDDATATILVTVNGTDYLATNNGDGTWTLADDTLPALADNSYTVTVTATDEAGNQGTATGTLEVDTVVPVVSVNDALTNDATPALTGTVDDTTASVTVTVNGTDYLATNNGDGTWTLADDTLPTLADNSYTVTVTATDEVGNQGTASGSLAVDTSAPSTGDGLNTITFNDGGDELLNADEAVSVSLSGEVEAGATINSIIISDGTTDIPISAANIFVDGSGAVTVNNVNLSNLNDGLLTVTMEVTDAVGNTGTVTDTTTLDTSIDGVAGEPIVSFDSITTDSGTDGDFITSDTTLVLTGTVNTTETTTLTVDVSGTEYIQGVSPELSVNGSGNWTLDLSDSALSVGTYIVVATVTDAAGNSESSPAQNVIIQVLDAVNDENSLDMGEPSVTVAPAQTTQDVQVIGVAESTEGVDASAAFNVSADHVGEVTVEVSQKSLVAVADAYKVEIYNASNELVYASVSADSQLADVGGLDIFNVTGDETITFTVDGLPAGDYTVVVRNDESQLEDLLDSDGSNDINLTELGDAGVVLGPGNQDSVLNTVEGTLGVVLGPAVRGILEDALETTTEIGAGELVDVLTSGLDGLGLTGSLDIVLSAVADALLSNTLTVLQDTDITTTVTEYSYDGVTEAQGNLISGDGSGLGEDTIIVGSTITVLENSTGQSVAVNASGITTIEGQFGTLEIESDGSYRYVAYGDRASVGQNDVFTYTLSDGETSDTATLSISISGSDLPAVAAQSDSIDMALGAQTSQVSEPVTNSDLQVLGLLESASSESVSTASVTPASISSTPIVVDEGFNGEVVVEVSQEALVAVADAYIVEIVDAQGQVVGQAVSPDNPLVGDVAGLTVLGLTGDDTLVANFSGLPAGEYTVVVRNDESELANLFDMSGDSNISLTELGAGGVVLGAENQDVLLDAIESAVNGSVLGSAGGLGVGSAVRTFILEPLLATVDSIGAGDLVDTLTTGLNAIGLTSVVDEVLDIVADTLLSNTLTLLQQTDVTSTLTEYQFEGSTTVSGNVIQGGGVGEVADSLASGGVVTQVTNSDGDLVTVLGSGTAGVTLSGEYGDLTVYEDGSYTYVANGARAGLGDSDSFTYTISDGFSSSSASLTFNLTGQGVASDTAIAELHYDHIAVVEPEVSDALNVNWLVSLGGTEFDTYNVEVEANTIQDLSFTLSNVDLLALGSSATLTLSQDVDGTMTEVESFSDDALLSLLSGNSNQVVFDGLTEGSYEVTLSVNVPVGVAGSVSASLTPTVHYLDQYAVDEVSIAEGNLFSNDVQFYTDYTLSVSEDGVNFQTITTSTTLVGQYGTLSVDEQGNYSYTPDSDLTVFGGTLNDTFSYRVEYPDGTVEQTELDVFVTATGEGVPEPVTTMMQAMLSYTSEDDVDLAFSESSDEQTVSLATSDSDGVMIEGVMFSDAGTMTQPLMIEDESNVGY
nr:BapA/Bap/LapF family large adhesin [uncultured Vibrio sp.]